MAMKSTIEWIFIIALCFLGYTVLRLKNQPLASEEYCDEPIMEFSLNQQECLKKFICKDKGNYRIRIKNVKLNSFWETDTFINAQIESAYGKRIVYYKPTRIKVDHRDDANVLYIDFSVPDMIPINKELLLKIHFSGDAKKFFQINPNVYFEIVKCRTK